MKKEHPETQAGEVFVTNITENDYEKLAYKTKRLGSTAYSLNGEVCHSLRPLFAMEDEVSRYIKERELVFDKPNFVQETMHPEIEDGEVWYSNVTYEEYEACQYRSKRLGTRPFSDSGSEITWDENLFPMFLSIEESETVGSRWEDMISGYLARTKK